MSEANDSYHRCGEAAGVDTPGTRPDLLRTEDLYSGTPVSGSKRDRLSVPRPAVGTAVGQKPNTHRVCRTVTGRNWMAKNPLLKNEVINMADLQVLPFAERTAIGTVAGNTAVLGTTKIDSTRTQGFRVTKLEVQVDLFFGTASTAWTGPVWIGICSSSLDATAVQAMLQSDPQSGTDQSELAKAMPFGTSMQSKYWILGVVSELLGAITIDRYPLLNPNGGPLHEIKLNRSFNDDEGLMIFAFNDDSVVINNLTTHITGKTFGVWLND